LILALSIELDTITTTYCERLWILN
jgi:hypothetical protein